MIWQNPWAWIGAIALAAPIAIHLLGRGRARVERFPSLRFLTASRLLPTRRTTLHDPLLLAVRLAILAAAVTALAQPLFLTAVRSRARNSTLARVIIVDTSASMRRATPGGATAVGAARAAARALGDSARPSITIETAAPASMVMGAAAWLSRQSSRTELAIISDFQIGTLSDSDLTVVAKTTGVRLARIAVSAAASVVETHARVAGTEVTAHTTLSPTTTTVEWSSAAPAGSSIRVQLLAGPAEQSAVEAAVRAAASAGVALPLDTARQIAIVYPGYQPRQELLRAASAPREVWMTDVLARMAGDSLLSDAARGALVDTAKLAGIVIARTADDRPIATAMQDSAGGHSRLLIFSGVSAGTLGSAALIAAADRSLSIAPAATELAPELIPDSTLAHWQRAPAAEAPSRPATGDGGESDGRWVWILALVLLGVESLVRRAPRATTAGESLIERAVHDRVA